MSLPPCCRRHVVATPSAGFDVADGDVLNEPSALHRCMRRKQTRCQFAACFQQQCIFSEYTLGGRRTSNLAHMRLTLLLLAAAVSSLDICLGNTETRLPEDDYERLSAETVSSASDVSKVVAAEGSSIPKSSGRYRPSAAREVRELFAAIDTESDGVVTREELQSWLVNNLAQHNNDDAASRMADDDSDRDGLLSWPEVAKSAVGHTQLGLNFSNDTVDREQELIMENVLNDDRQRFSAADTNGDGLLNITEYAAFIHPYDYSHMASYEIDRALADLDRNHDEAIDEAEVFQNAPATDVDGVSAEKANFDLSDLDGDGRLTGEEILHWVSHDLDTMAIEESNRLFDVTDANGDDVLTEDEVAAQHEEWIDTEDQIEQRRRTAASVKDEL